jgi:23S rRNA (guanosine2251-2'-O)-methyltransferase
MSGSPRRSGSQEIEAWPCLRSPGASWTAERADCCTRASRCKCLAAANESTSAPLLVALDGVTDPRNLGAVIRSALAFGAHGVILPERRSAGVTAVAWRTSAGTAARLPVAQVTNLVRALKDCQKAGLLVIGLDADASSTLDHLDAATDPLVVVVGSEGRGLSRLVGDTCDFTLAIPMDQAAESLNASVAVAVTLAEIARRRRN